MKKYIILESANDSPLSNVKEDQNGSIVFTATLQRANYKNRNGRIYPKDVLDEAIHSPIVQENLSKHTLYGEAGHPSSTDVSRQTTIDLRNVAFLIENLWWDGDLLKATCKTASTMAGKDMAGLIRDGSRVSFSLRAQGNVLKDPTRDALVVQRPLGIIGWDWVWVPSNQDAMMDIDINNAMSESTQNSMYNYGKYKTKQIALTESINLFTNGSLTETCGNAKSTKKIIDYTKTYRKKIKPLKEMYIYDNTDNIKTVSPYYVVLENADAIKKVSLQDYLLKSIRSTMLDNLCESRKINRHLSEDVCDIAAPDISVGVATAPMTAADEKIPSVTTADMGFGTVTPDIVPVTKADAAQVQPSTVNTTDVQKEAATEPVSGLEKSFDDAGIGGNGVAVPASTIATCAAKDEIKKDDAKAVVPEKKNDTVDNHLLEKK